MYGCSPILFKLKFNEARITEWNVRCKTDFAKDRVNFDQNNAKEGLPKFDKLIVRGLF